MSIPPEADEVFFDDPDEDLQEDEQRFSLWAKLVILLLILALLTTLVWPLLRGGPRRVVPPTPTPLFLREA
ncbi:MAG: hypothetical protein JXM69_08785 [Anaerolineae bacterium]|nr:hypothetical protein [Anaerolineae bacterium]